MFTYALHGSTYLLVHHLILSAVEKVVGEAVASVVVGSNKTVQRQGKQVVVAQLDGGLGVSRQFLPVHVVMLTLWKVKTHYLTPTGQTAENTVFHTSKTAKCVHGYFFYYYFNSVGLPQ